MWKYIVVGVMAAVLFLSLAAWADTGGSATATLEFTSVINTLVDGSNWGDLTIDQKTTDYSSVAWLAGNYTTGYIDWGNPTTTDDITVTVQAMTSFNVYTGYYASSATGFSFPGDLQDTTGDSFIRLYEGSPIPGSGLVVLNYYTLVSLGITDITSHGLSDTAADSSLTKLSWTGTSTLSGETHNYEVAWNPGDLPSDLAVNDSVDLTIYFVVTDPTT